MTNTAGPARRGLEPIAIVGIGCRFPGADGGRAFWRLLSSATDAVADVPPGRRRDFMTPGGGTQRAGLLEGVDGFDWRAFRIAPREAKFMDPQHRLLLEVAWEAFEDAGVPFEQVAGRPVGVYVAIMWNDYVRAQGRHPEELTGYSMTGNGFAFAAGRISYTFDLRGPSVAIDAACAGSLASLHAACQSLWLGENEMALAGGVNLVLAPDATAMLSQAGVLSTVGRCSTLDSAADGFVRGEGAGLLVLKRASDVTSSDRVYAYVRGSAVNHNGRNEWIMAASGSAQQAVLESAYRVAGVDPATVDYVELHGTGLPKGDPIEVQALGRVIGMAAGRDHPCSVGAVKTNLGHLDSAAGIAGVIKVALAMREGVIPPTLHLSDPNPAIPLDELGLVAQVSCGPWPAPDRPAVAGVTAISMAGANAHVVLEAPAREPSVPSFGGAVVPLSAPTPESLVALADALRSSLHESPDVEFADIAYTAALGRTHQGCRLAIVATTLDQLRDGLSAFLAGRETESVLVAVTGTDTDVPALPDDVKALVAAVEARRYDDGRLPADGFSPRAVAVLFVRGQDIDWASSGLTGRVTSVLPTVPWRRDRVWLDWLDGGEPDSVAASASTPELVARYHDAAARDRATVVIGHVRARVAAILGIDADRLAGSGSRLFDVGMNSLSALEVANALGRDVGRDLPATLVFEHSTVEAIADYLLTEVLAAEAPSAGSPPSTASDEGSLDVGSLTEEEAAALLSVKLNRIRGG
ncbi:MAG: beta-ketoacyl synthase N-terminal-like domain-containing protein [Gaiella sp.]